MLGPQKSLSGSFVVDAKGSQAFLAVLSASEATRDKCVCVCACVRACARVSAEARVRVHVRVRVRMG